jgi:hypothetical protein
MGKVCECDLTPLLLTQWQHFQSVTPIYLKMNTIFRCHQKLHAGREGPMVNKQPLHLRQGELDSSCGPQCAMMSLILMGALHRDDLYELDGSTATRNRALNKMWKRSTDLYFTGSSPKELQSLFAPYSEIIRSRLLRKEGRNVRAVDCLEQDGLCILGVHNDDFSHWVLAVGFTTQGKLAKPKNFLLLDSDAAALPLMPWNATLSVTPNLKGKYRYESEALSTLVTLDTALALKPA